MNNNHAAILKVLADTEWRTIKEIAAALTFDMQNISFKLRDMVKQKLVAKTMYAKNPYFAITHHGTFALMENNDAPAA